MIDKLEHRIVSSKVLIDDTKGISKVSGYGERLSSPLARHARCEKNWHQEAKKKGASAKKRVFYMSDINTTTPL